MIVSDFRREYSLTPEAMYSMPTLQFLWYLNGLSENSRWVQLNNEKKNRRSAGRAGGGRRR